MANLYLVRHGKSVWNKDGLWTGHHDIDLHEDGLEEAKKAGEALKSHTIHRAFTSDLKRTHQTYEQIRKELDTQLEHSSHSELKERNYGIHSKKNKWQVKEEIGEEAFQAIRRGWDVEIEGGETLKDVYKRAAPFYESHIMPLLREGQNVLLVSHGNTLRALAKHIENIHENDIADVEFETGAVYCYQFDDEGKFIAKELLAT